MSLYGKEKIWFLVNRLLDEREVTSIGHPVALHPANDLNKHYLRHDLINIADKLEKEHNAVKLLNTAPTDQTYGKYLFELLPGFDDYVRELRKDPKYLDWIGEKPEPTLNSDAKKDDTSDELILFLAVVAQSFTDSKNEPISLSLADFKPLSFKQVNEFVDHFAGSKTFIVLSRPKTAKDATPYKLEQTEYQKAEFAKTKAEMEHLRDIQMLVAYFGRVCTIYDAVAGGYVGFEDGQLNRMYVLLSIRIDKILAKDEFTELREAKPELYDTLMGSYEDLDMAYEFMRPEIWGYYGKLERLWLEKAEDRSFELTEDEKKLIEDTDKAIEQHSERKSRLNANFEKRLEQDAPKIREHMFGKDMPNQHNEKEQSNQPKEKPAKDAKPIPKKITVHTLEPEHYNKRKGVLLLSPTDKVFIAKRGKVKRNNGKKYDQCYLLELLFNNVNTLKSGVSFSRFLGVSATKIGKNEEKKIRNTMQEINEKVADVGGPKNLIKMQNQKVFINSSYL